ncbi:MAG: helix-turn-helix transcriptional regulator [Roseivirga sp.]|nr:helix-turn-helix transcriptional regulator [Roseivirga sp.]
MIHEYKTIELFGKLLFEKVILSPPFKKPNPMTDEACFLYIIEGQYHSISEKDLLRVNTRESVLMKCGNYLSQMHASGHGDRYEAVAVHFFPDILKRVYENQLPGFLKVEYKDAPPLTQSKIEADILIHKYIDSILFYFENQSLVNEDILILKLKEIILLLNQTVNAPAIRAILSNLFNPGTFSFRQVIEAHLYSSIGTEELAALTNMSLSTFKREFKKIYNMSPASYLKSKKLEKAASLLTLPEVRIGDIAYDCGFTDMANFSRAFKQKYGVPPSQYSPDELN